MTINELSSELSQWGWRPFFQQQLSLEEWENTTPARIVNYQRSVFTAQSGSNSFTLSITASTPAMTVGDWILLDEEQRFVRLLDRASLFTRKAAGPKVDTQLIAANIDTVFIVCSMNQDFSLNRIERYLALVHEAQVEPVVVLSKADLCNNPEDFIQQVQALDPLLMVLAVNGLDPESVRALATWFGIGNTIALLGSSGVGKSTLVNTLMGRSTQATAAIRENDGEGRHTTTSRSLHQLPDGSLFPGGLVLDTPGMRELQLTASEQAVAATFADIADLASRCRFGDCQHEREPGCAVRTAIENGDLDERRFTSYQKLLREQALNSATLAERRSRERKLGKMYRKAQFAHEIKRKD